MRLMNLSMIIVCILLTIMSGVSVAQPSFSQLGRYCDKMMSHRLDLTDLAGYSKGLDQEAAFNLIGVAKAYTSRLDHLRDLVHIYSLISSKDDKQRIRAVITDRMEFIVKEIDISLKEVNLYLSRAESPAIISIGNQIKSDLREIQKMIASRFSR